MLLQGCIVLVLVGGASAYLIRRVWRVVSGKQTGCHCGTAVCPAKQSGNP